MPGTLNFVGQGVQTILASGADGDLSTFFGKCQGQSPANTVPGSGYEHFSTFQI